MIILAIVQDRVRLYETVYTTVRFTRVYTRFYTTNTVSYDRHTTNTVQVRIIHGQVRPDTVSTSVQSSCMIIQHSNTTENTTTCWHLETTEYLLHNASKDEEGPQKNPHHGRFSQREYKKGHQDPSVELFSCPNLPPSSSPSNGLFLSPLAPSGQNNLNVYQCYPDF